MDKYVMCIDRGGYRASLTAHKVYKVIPDPAAEKHGQLRIIDDSGEDYLFGAKHFVEVSLPAAAQVAFGRVPA